MYYCNYFRHHEPEETYNENVDEFYSDYDSQQYDDSEIPPYCPYRYPYFGQYEYDRQPGPGYPGGQPYGPPQGPPQGQHQGSSHNGPPQGQHNGHPQGQQPGSPPGPPPTKAPVKSQKSGGAELKAVDPGSIRPCLYRYVYIWPKRGKSFWAWLTYVGRQSASGFKWNGHRWVYFGMDLRDIQSFQCY